MDTIVPRHFLQIAVTSGIPAAVVEDICAELTERAGTAIDDTLASLPEGFPAALADSITGGMRTRLRTLELIPA
jgi:serine/threonine-protein kinase HipA